MFKAKLIQNKEYYQLRSQQLWLGLIPLFLIGLLANFYSLPLYLVIIFMAIYGITTFFIFRKRHQMNALSEGSTIQMNAQQISILHTHKAANETIQLSDVERIVVKEAYTLAQETMSDLKDEMLGKANEHFIILHQENQARRLDFEIDTHFKINQLNKLIAAWQAQGYRIEKC